MHIMSPAVFWTIATVMVVLAAAAVVVPMFWLRGADGGEFARRRMTQPTAFLCS